MSTTPPHPRRRLLLPIGLAGLLLVACGVAGYVGYRQWGRGEVANNSEVAGDLNEGFAEAKAEGGAEPVDRWVDVVPAATISPPAAEPTPEVEPLEAGNPLPPLSTGVKDRYVEQAAAQEPAPLEAEAPLPPLENDRYAMQPLAPLPTQEPQPLTDEVSVARGQTPSADDYQGAENGPANPLRDSGSTSSIPESARAAFDEAEALNPSPASTPPLGPPPGQPLSANPLRTSSDESGLPPQDRIAPEPEYAASEETDAPPQGEFASAQPLAATPSYGDSAPRHEPMGRYSEPMHSAAGTNQPNPMASLSNSAAPVTPQNDERDPYSMPSERALAPLEQESVPAGLGGEGTGRPGERSLEGPQRPALIVQKFAPPEIQVGKAAKFVIKVRNVGQRQAEEVQVVDEVPQGTQLVGTSPQAETAGGTLTWNLGTLSPGEERTLEVELQPTTEGEIGSVARVSFSSQASAKTRCTRPQLALRLSSPSEVLVGRQQPVTIELHNPGTGDATGVMLVENVPDNVSHPAGPSLEFEVGTLRAGETRRMELILTAEKPGHVVNILTAQAEGNLQVQQQVEFEVIAPSLAVGIDGPAKRYLERPATYTVTIDNPGTATARDVQLVTKLPRAMQFVRTNNRGEYDAATHAVYWSLAELPEGEKGEVELVTLPIQAGDHVLEVEGRAREGLQDRTSQQVSIEGLVAIMFEVTDTADPIEVGGSTSYDIRVVNQGSKAASNVQVRVLVPQGMKVSGATGETRHVVEAAGVMFAPLQKLAPKADSVFRVQLEGMSPGDQRIAVEVVTDELSQPIRKEESTRVFGDE